MEAGVEEGFVRVDVSDARENLLVHQERFDRARAAFGELAEIPQIEVGVEGIGSELLGVDYRVRALDEVDLAELPLTVVREVVAPSMTSTRSMR